MHLADYLRVHNLTQHEFAARVGVTVRGVGKWVRGERVPRPSQMRRIVEASDGEVTPNDFLVIRDQAA